MPPWLFPALGAIGAVLAAFFGTYLSKRGEILAIQKELDKVVQQTKRLTTATESIKQDLANRSWIQQRNRQLKEEIVLAAFREAMNLQDKVRDLYTEYQVACQTSASLDKRLQLRTQYEAMHAAFERFFQHQILTRIVCSPDAADSFSLVGAIVLKIEKDFTENKFGDMTTFDKIAEQSNHWSSTPAPNWK